MVSHTSTSTYTTPQPYIYRTAPPSAAAAAPSPGRADFQIAPTKRHPPSRRVVDDASRSHPTRARDRDRATTANDRARRRQSFPSIQTAPTHARVTSVARGRRHARRRAWMTFARENQSSSIHPSTTNDHDSDASHDASDARATPTKSYDIYILHTHLCAMASKMRPRLNRVRVYMPHARARISSTSTIGRGTRPTTYDLKPDLYIDR